MEELKKETAEMKEKLNIKEQIIKEYEIKVQKLATPQQRMSMKITEVIREHFFFDHRLFLWSQGDPWLHKSNQ